MRDHLISLFILPKTDCYLALSGTRLDQQDIAIVHHIVLALRHDLSGSLGSAFIAVFPQGVVVVHNGLDECLLEICSFISISIPGDFNKRTYRRE